MRIDLTYFTPLLVSAAAAVAIVAAPIATAAPTPLEGCLVVHTTTTCQRPGNVEITRPRPPVSIYPYGTMPILLGGR